MFCTYAHYTPQGKLFYIGKGSSLRRAKNFKNRNKYWNNVVKKHGKPKVEILATWSTESEAFEHEKFLILCFRNLNYDLCNLTDGGEGVSGYKQTAEHKAKTNLKLKGRPGKKHSLETIQKLRISHLGQKAWNKGIRGVVKQSPETIAKRSAKMVGHMHNVKFKYTGTNMLTMEIVEFIGNPAMKNAGFDPARIRDCASGKRKRHKNYTWVKQLLGGSNVCAC